MSTRIEEVIIEAVNSKVPPKFAKYQSGSILANGKWMNVSKDLNIRDFNKGESAKIEIETNEAGYDKVVSKVGSVPKPTVEYGRTLKTGKEEQPIVGKYTDDVQYRILVQGITQAAAQAPALAGLPYTSVAELSKNTTEYADSLISYVQSKLQK